MAETQWTMLGRPWLTATVDPVSHTIDATNDGVGTVLQAPKAGTINAIGYYLVSKNGAPTFDVRMEQLTGQFCNGTLWSTTTNADSADPAAGWNWVTLTSGGTVTKGQYFGVCVVGKTISAGVHDGIVWKGATGGAASSLPTNHVLTAGTWTAEAVQPCVAARYDDGEVVVGPVIMSALSRTGTLGNATTPDELGTSWVAPCNGSVHGMAFFGDPLLRAQTGALTLYSGTGASPTTVESSPYSFAYARANYASGVHNFWLPETAITAGTTYHLVLTPDVSDTVRVVELEFSSATDRMAYFGLGMRTERSGRTGAFTISNAKAVGMIPMISQLSGGGGVFPGFGGSGLV